MVEASVYVFAFTEPGFSACLLKYELHHCVGQPGMGLTGLGVSHHVVVTPFGQSKPGGELIRPGDDLAVPSL